MLKEQDSKAAEIELEKMSIPLKADYWWKEHLSSNSSFISDVFCGKLLSRLNARSAVQKAIVSTPFMTFHFRFRKKSQSAQKNQTEGFRCCHPL